MITSTDEAALVEALHSVKALHRPVPIYFPRQDIYLLGWLEAQALDRVLVSDGQNTVCLVDDSGTLP